MLNLQRNYEFIKKKEETKLYRNYVGSKVKKSLDTQYTKSNQETNVLKDKSQLLLVVFGETFGYLVGAQSKCRT